MDESVQAYLRSVAEACTDVLGDNLTSAWIVGSLVTHDFDMRRSDIDVLMTCATSIGIDAKEALGQRLTHDSLPCPAHGVDLLIYLASEVMELRRAPRYEFSISSGVDWKDEIDLGGAYPGGLIDLAAARQVGMSFFGSTPQDVLGQCPDEWILEELASGVRWQVDTCRQGNVEGIGLWEVAFVDRF